MSRIENQPRLLFNHVAAVRAPRANTARSRTVCVSSMVSDGPSKPTVWVPGTEPTLVLWAILREMRNLWSQLHPGARLPAVWTTSPAAAGAAAGRLRKSNVRSQFMRLAERASRADRTIKGRLKGQPWDELALLATELAGVRVLALPRNVA